MSLIITVKDKLDIVTEIQADGVTLKKGGRVWKGLCPFHAEKTPSFTVDPDSQSYRCYGSCGAYGDVLDFYAKRHNLTLNETLDHFTQRLGIKRKKVPNSAATQRLHGLLNVVKQAYMQAYKKTPLAQAYLQGRGITDEDVQKWGIGFAPGSYQQDKRLLHYLKQLGYDGKTLVQAGLVTQREDKSWRDFFVSRLIFPIHDSRGRVVGFGGRKLAGKSVKYINSPERTLFNKHHLLYGFHLAQDAIRKKREVIVVEGYTDAISAHRAGYTHTVASMGTSLTEEQVQLLHAADRIILAMDGDNAGRKAMRRALDHVGKLNADIFIARLPDEVDVDSTIQQGIFDDILVQAIPATDYLIERTALLLTEKASVVERTRIATQALPLLTQLENDVVRKTSVQQLAQRFDLDVSALYRQAPISQRVSQIPTQSKSPSLSAEEFTLAAFLHDRRIFDDVQANLTLLDQPLDDHDFPYLHTLFACIASGQSCEEIATSLGADTIPVGGDYALTVINARQQALRLRLKRIKSEMQTAFESGQDLRHLKKRKAVILKEYRNG